MIKKKTSYQNNSYIVLFFVLFGLIFARYCYYGFEYYYQLDDYIQYHNFTAYSDDLWKIIKSLGLLSARPLAGLFDLFIWSRFYSFMIIAVGIISALYAFSAVFFHKVFSKMFGTGYMFFLIYALLPLGFEGTYWISASSRIVVGIFFASVSLLFFDKWCEEGNKKSLILFSVFQFVSFCFYEQIVLLSGALTFILMLYYAKSYDKKRALWGFIMFLNAALYFVITHLFPSGINGDRSVLFLPWQDNYKVEVFDPLLTQLRDVFLAGNTATLGKGLIRGLELFIAEPNFLYVLIILFLCAGFFVISKQASRDRIRFFAEMFSGIFLALVPLLLFFVLKNPWFSARNAVTSFCGMALIVDALFDLILGRTKRGSLIQGVLLFAIAMLLCTASISELHDYREETVADAKIASATAEAFQGLSFSSKDYIWLLNVDASYVSDGNFYYHDHVYGVASSGWALTGAVSAFYGRGNLPEITPVSVYRHFPVAEEKINKAIAFFYTGESVVPVSLKKSADAQWEVRDIEGKLLGTLTYKDEGLLLKVQ